MEMDEPHTLVVLAEEELVLIDLETQGWPSFALPYLNSLHCSPITCSQHVSNVPDNLWQKIADAGQAQNKNLSSREWPINGGKIAGAESLTKDLLLTGHEDGTVRFWDASSTSMSLLYKLSTASLFNVEIHGDHNSGEVEEGVQCASHKLTTSVLTLRSTALHLCRYQLYTQESPHPPTYELM